MNLSNLKPAEGSTKTRKRIGRGAGSGLRHRPVYPAGRHIPVYRLHHCQTARRKDDQGLPAVLSGDGHSASAADLRAGNHALPAAYARPDCVRRRAT